jgi:sugar lactone lactonase YvrE
MKTYLTNQRILMELQIVKKLLGLGLMVILLCFSACKKNPVPIIIVDNVEDKYEDPAFTSFSPLEGAMNTIITINGKGFSIIPQHNDVTINDKRAVIISSTLTSMQVKVPPGAGTGKVSVRIGNQILNSAKDFVYRYTVSTLAGNDTPGRVDGKGEAASFWFPGGVAVDLSGNVYIGDTGNGAIRKISRNGEVSTLAGGKIGPFKDGPGKDATFYNPNGVAVHTDGTVYVADNFNHAIRKITSDGYVSTFAGINAGVGGVDFNFGFVDGQGKDARFNYPMGIAIDQRGYLYVADSKNKAIRRISPTGLVSTLASNGRSVIKSGYGSSVELNNPVGIAVDAVGNVYVADAGSHQIKKVTPDGNISIFAGAGTVGSNDGAGLTAQFQSPIGIAIDPTGSFYVSDASNHRIRKITAAGVVSTLAGNFFGFADGSANTAQFYAPVGVAIDPNGIIYVSDSGNSRIRIIQ